MQLSFVASDIRNASRSSRLVAATFADIPIMASVQVAVGERQANIAKLSHLGSVAQGSENRYCATQQNGFGRRYLGAPPAGASANLYDFIAYAILHR